MGTLSEFSVFSQAENFIRDGIEPNDTGPKECNSDFFFKESGV